MAALLPDRALAALRIIKVRALQVIGVGGDTWTVARTVGDGITAPVTISSASSVTGYAYRERLSRQEAALAGTRVPTMPWRFVIVTGTVQAGDTLTSAADTTIRFTAQQPDPDPLYPVAIIEPLR